VRPLAILAMVSLLPIAGPRVAAQTDLDAFMKRVVARRDDNWKKLQQYVLDERQQVSLLAPGLIRLWGERRDYTWFIQDGYFVRSPVAVNGVGIADAERREAEAQYLRRVKRRDEAGLEGRDDAGNRPPADTNALIQQVRQPEFISSSYFLNFKFDEGRYAFVGHETLDGRDVLRIEYYPTKLFSDNPAEERRPSREGRGNQDDEVGRAVQRLMDKTSLVTLWVEPESSQIVKYTFDNVGLDFLPGSWLVDVDSLRATMTMSQPFPDVWLPASIDMDAVLQLAVGAFDVRYRVEYRDYRQAETSGRLVQP
jgi:hypothetical protein